MKIEFVSEMLLLIADCNLGSTISDKSSPSGTTNDVKIDVNRLPSLPVPQSGGKKVSFCVLMIES